VPKHFQKEEKTQFEDEEIKSLEGKVEDILHRNSLENILIKKG
jgi:hypothetical protein